MGRHGPRTGLQQVHPQKRVGLGLLGPIWRQWPVTNGGDRSWRARGCLGPFESAGDPALLVFHSLPALLPPALASALAPPAFLFHPLSTLLNRTVLCP